MRIGIHGKDFTRQSAPFIENIFNVLSQHRVDIYVSSLFKKSLKSAAFKKFKFKTYEPGQSLKDLKCLLSVGGDGTLLQSLTHIGNTGTPILGINTGRLGFLATISLEETENALKKSYFGRFLARQTHHFAIAFG